MKQKRILILFIAVTVLAVVLGVSYFAAYETLNHANLMDRRSLLAYNSTLTARAHTASWIGQDMVLVLHSLNKDLETDAQAVFYIYQLPEGADSEDYLSLRTSQIPADDGLVHMGSLSCRLPADEILSAYDIQVSFIR